MSKLKVNILIWDDLSEISVNSVSRNFDNAVQLTSKLISDINKLGYTGETGKSRGTYDLDLIIFDKLDEMEITELMDTYQDDPKLDFDFDVNIIYAEYKLEFNLGVRRLFRLFTSMNEVESSINELKLIPGFQLKSIESNNYHEDTDKE